jgi:nucleotide-binding universal stress UspA family protein
MKTILVPTDFSPAANNAARYALHLAKGINAYAGTC